MKKNNIESQILVIFGSNGDLSKRKLLPAVFQLYIDNLLPENFVVVGAGSQEKDEVAYRVDVRESLSIFSKKTIAEYPEKLEEFLLTWHY
jgi:glucose-6-phosphate 1-dehydrogenase